MSLFLPVRSSRRGRRHTIVLLTGLALAACDHTESFTPGGDATALTEAVPLGVAPSAVAFAGGIPIGMFAQPVSLYGERYNGGHRNSLPADLPGALESIRNQGGKAVVVFAGSNNNYKDADGHFSLSLWQTRVNRYRNVNLTSYIEDGTIIAHYLVDEPNDPNNWNGQPIPGEMLDSMARYSKDLWPSMPTVIRVDAAYLRQWGIQYQYLDAAWAQYVERKGAAADYLARNVADAKALGLELIVGLNLLKGGPGNTALTAGQIQDYGSVLLGSTYPCAFISWQYDANYLAGAGIGEAMDVLRGLAQNRSAKSCARGSTPPPDPDPPEPETTTTTIAAAGPDPSAPGQAVTVEVTVASDGSTPEGTVVVSATGGSESCEATLSGGAGTCALTLTEAGDRTLHATYAGSTSHAASSDTEPHEVEVAQQSVAISWATPANIVYGTALGAGQLNASASAGGSPVAGTFAYTPAAGTVLNAGPGQTLRATFTPSDPGRFAGGEGSVAITVVARAPTLAWSVPSAITVGPLAASVLTATASGLGGAPVPGTFTYSPAAGSFLDAATSQTLSVSFQPSSGNYTTATRSVTVAVRYPWSGFFEPVDNSRLNTAKAGVAIPVRFSLGGNRPAPVVASGSPESRAVSCPSWPTDAIEQTVSASSSSIKYETSTGRYVYTWKTSTSWANSCRRLTITLKDGTRHEATFRFSR